jgi:hypothetical protein
MRAIRSPASAASCSSRRRSAARWLAMKMLVAGEKDGWFGSDEDYRRIARGFPSVYALTPSYRRRCR